MQIVCPTCATGYEVDASSIGAAGRSVRCVRCRSIWLAPPPAPDAMDRAAPVADDEAVAAFKAELAGEAPLETTEALRLPAAELADPQPDGPPADELMTAGESSAATDALPVTDIETVAAASSEAEHPIDLDAGRPIVIDEAPTETPPGQPPGNGEPAEVASLAVHRRQRAGRRPPPPKPAPRRRLPMAIVGLLAVIGALIGWRGEVVRHAPQMASLYGAIGLPVNLRKLVFAEVRIARDTHDGVPMLLIQGAIVSTSPTPLEVPRLRFAVRNAAGAELYSWTAQPTQSKLAPFEAFVFQNRLASPPGDAHDIVVRFFTRRDAVASLR